MDSDTPICVVHLNVERSEDIEITESTVLRSLDGFMNEQCIDRETIKQEHDIDMNREGPVSVKNVKEEVSEKEKDIENSGGIDKVDVKQEPLDAVVKRYELSRMEGVKKEFAEELDLIELEILTNKEELRQEKCLYINKEAADPVLKIKTSGEYKEARDVEATQPEATQAESTQVHILQTEPVMSHPCAPDTEKHSLSKIIPIVCDIYHRTFTRKSSLNRHSKIHTGVEPFKSEICQRRFTMKDDFNRHTRSHEQKPVQWEICERTLKNECYLRIHLRSHIAENAFECEICQQKFNVKSNLNKHSRIHTRETF